MSLNTDTGKKRESGWWETVKIVIQALALAMVVRVFFYQPFNIPSGSMKSTLLVGDYLFVSKLSYGYSRYSFPFGLNLFSGRIFASPPQRGDVAVFKLPRDNSTDYIKRVIGLPGDEIQMRNGVLYINGQAVPKVRVEDFVTREEDGVLRRIPQYEETLPNGVKYRVLDSEPNGPFDNTACSRSPRTTISLWGTTAITLRTAVRSGV
jgi:signal peptidase I